MGSEAISAFWQWWTDAGKAEASVLFAGGGDQERFNAFAEELGALVGAIDPGLGVATGPGRTAQHCLVVTAAGDEELREVAAAWLAAAPEADAEFEYADRRQPHPEPQSLALRFPGGVIELAHTTVLAVVDGRVVHLQLSHPRFAELSENDRLQVAFMFLDAVLGEEAVEERIGQVEVVVDHEAGTTPGRITELPELLAAV